MNAIARSAIASLPAERRERLAARERVRRVVTGDGEHGRHGVVRVPAVPQHALEPAEDELLDRGARRRARRGRAASARSPSSAAAIASPSRSAQPAVEHHAEDRRCAPRRSAYGSAEPVGAAPMREDAAIVSSLSATETSMPGDRRGKRVAREARLVVLRDRGRHAGAPRRPAERVVAAHDALQRRELDDDVADEVGLAQVRRARRERAVLAGRRPPARASAAGQRARCAPPSRPACRASPGTRCPPDAATHVLHRRPSGPRRRRTPRRRGARG